MPSMNSQAHMCKIPCGLSLCIHNLRSPYSKWFMKSLGVQQFHKLLAGFEDKGAQAVCTFAYSEGPGHEPIIFQGRTKVRFHDPSPG
jgi:inosine/xanthosine triphosphate pyrophosphatase family protein